MIEFLAEVVTKNLKHEHYERVTELADDYKAYVTGIGLDDMMKQFVMRESAEAFEHAVGDERTLQTVYGHEVNKVVRAAVEYIRVAAKAVEWQRASPGVVGGLS